MFSRRRRFSRSLVSWIWYLKKRESVTVAVSGVERFSEAMGLASLKVSRMPSF